jgi:uncharacterized protein YjbI with pentapeptide repeats
MDIRTVRELRIALPEIERDELSPAEPPDVGEDVADALVDSAGWAQVRLSRSRLSRSRFEGADLTGSVFVDCRFVGVELVNVDLTSARFEGATFERCAITGTRLAGTRLVGVTLKDVVFEGCRLDYAVLDRVRATGPAAFLGCGFADANLTGCALGTVAFDDCLFERTELDGCDLRAADLRGNDLAGIQGIMSLRGAVVQEGQLAGITAALVRELGVILAR